MLKKITGFSLDVNVIEAIKELARRDKRNFSNYVNLALTEHIKRAGYEIRPYVKTTKLKRRKA